MGWTSYYATYYKNGRIDRKAECDAYFLEGLNRGQYEVLKSVLVGSTYYAAVKTVGSGKVWAAVFLTSADKGDFYYKNMDETCGPCQIDCPESILKLLDETDHEYALEWRKRCREHISARKSLNKLPVGSIISFKRGEETVKVIKSPACYQFKKPFWKFLDMEKYITFARIPDDFEVIIA